MSASSNKLAQAINQLPFASAVEHEQQASAINVLCRIKPGNEAAWAAVAERVLREANKYQGTQDFWHTHIARLYMLRNNKLVYGWTFGVMSQKPENSIAIIVNILNAISGGQNPQPAPEEQTDEEEESDDGEGGEEGSGTDEDDDYTDAEGPLPRGAVPEADIRGNPIVPRSARIKKIEMAGLPKNFDRNAPTKRNKNKGSWGIGSGRNFRPPVRT